MCVYVICSINLDYYINNFLNYEDLYKYFINNFFKDESTSKSTINNKAIKLLLAKVRI